MHLRMHLRMHLVMIHSGVPSSVSAAALGNKVTSSSSETKLAGCSPGDSSFGAGSQ